ncbi:transporter substrate-binding domain-containing protein [Prosthecomicrobium pneumaticum]|uniref:Polar amino acid transport system substrate-binding protein n=1 Tax=Prosthecomicrobium pneumaticum TaxID=81895 RepID=A0A7W9L2B1_9HYPH|nr:transporter substrate-binding domain-containing protein [Prosthecomicrobium pneumaticum]MBB5753369.1 polar amino acid transport system substrate-binding protein [Prosthecomicrobium pneumaticum]
MTSTKRRWRAARLLGPVALVLATLVPAAALPAAAGQASPPAPIIPNFWDPARRIERPPAGSIPGIRFATVDDFPPFSFIGPDGQPTGFNVDLARAICVELMIACTIQVRPYDGLADAVAAKRVDAALAGIAITPESRRMLAFSDVYLRSPARFVARRGAEPAAVSPAALAGRTVAVRAGTAHEAYLAALFPTVKRLALADDAAVRTALREQKADLLFGDGVQLSFWLQSEAAGACCGFVGGPYLEQRFFGEGFAIALPKDATALRTGIDAALDALYDRGTFAELYLRYFPVGFF